MKQHGLELTVDVLNGHIGAWLAEVAHRRLHATTGEKPQRLLEQERFALQTLPKPANLINPPPILSSVVPIESFQHPLSTYDALLEARI